MSQHSKKDKDTRQRKNVDNSHKQKTGNNNSTSSSSSATSNSNSAKKETPTKKQQQQQHPKKVNNGNLPLSMKQTKNNNNKQLKEKLKAEREALVLWRHPIQTLSYCSLEIVELVKTLGRKLIQRKIWIGVFVVLASFIAILYHIPGPHQVLFEFLKLNTWFVVYWTGLGILSSVGLGTGLHTFLLYLGPHIASVTLAAYECNSLNFPKPPYPDDIICPEEPYDKQVPNLWTIMSKVRLEAFLWGAGTALGELPPYFMAKAARLSGYDPDDAEELAEFEALKAKRNQKDLSLMDRGKLFMERVVERIGFLGILACASIPNPLFDLAGITCGHFLVPFWTFFGATLIGKAIVKMHIQKVFVIIAFNEVLIERAVDTLSVIPVVGKKLQEPFKAFLNNQKMRLHRQRNAAPAEAGNLLSKIFETFVIGMVCYFVVSIINSLAQSYHKRLNKYRTNSNSTTPSSHNAPSPTTVVSKKTKKAALRE
ncbi:vacuole membrane protein 1 [Musca domestica]|uniref:Vacuole membrane protein 1 n=1 Tax=Musca domestica TaxID=7370 RepID=A0A9J7I4D7_MUSDO|nr:vacuole membrane protein 1 [Musca domestica]XP_005187647.2 vacuole membrane protein 1 [Musca domestica]XP_005187648.2 vacuole membrane protein 1 [Musca domestica]XP_011294200.2 vacuole membrane protein 1 [Musca domestica]